MRTSIHPWRLTIVSKSGNVLRQSRATHSAQKYTYASFRVDPCRLLNYPSKNILLVHLIHFDLINLIFSKSGTWSVFVKPVTSFESKWPDFKALLCRAVAIFTVFVFSYLDSFKSGH